MEDSDQYRCRLIYLKQSDSHREQAVSACEALAAVDGILLAAPSDVRCVHLIYSLDKLTFELITDLINELGFEIDNSMLLILRNNIYQYLDENARENMNIDIESFQVKVEETPEIPDASSDKYWEDYH